MMTRESKDRLEKFISDHRNELDYADPPDGVWENVQNDLNTKKGSRFVSSNNYSWMWKVAAAIFFAMTVYLSIEKYTNSSTSNEVTMAMNEYGFEEFQNTEKYYNDVIQVKRNELNKVLSNDKELHLEFSKDIAELDSMYMLLKKDFEVNNDELVVDAMIYNLRLRIEILDRQLQIIKNLNTLEKTKNEARNI